MVAANMATNHYLGFLKCLQLPFYEQVGNHWHIHSCLNKWYLVWNYWWSLIPYLSVLILLIVNSGYRNMFWSDWSATRPRIMKAWLDGSNSLQIVNGSDRVHWPNGLAIDMSTQLLYFTDAYLDKISKCNLDGSGFRVLIEQSSLVQHPYAIAVFKVNCSIQDLSITNS